MPPVPSASLGLLDKLSEHLAAFFSGEDPRLPCASELRGGSRPVLQRTFSLFAPLSFVGSVTDCLRFPLSLLLGLGSWGGTPGLLVTLCDGRPRGTILA